jgi:hypothetical protein
MLLKRPFIGSEYERFGPNPQQFKRPNFRGAKFEQKLQNKIACCEQEETIPAKENHDCELK